MGTLWGVLIIRESYYLGICIRGSPICVNPRVSLGVSTHASYVRSFRMQIRSPEGERNPNP